jgi:hypothetical protein
MDLIQVGDRISWCSSFDLLLFSERVLCTPKAAEGKLDGVGAGLDRSARAKKEQGEMCVDALQRLVLG